MSRHSQASLEGHLAWEHLGHSCRGVLLEKTATRSASLSYIVVRRQRYIATLPFDKTSNFRGIHSEADRLFSARIGR